MGRISQLLTHPIELASTLLILVLAITLHEWGHAFAAHRCGDDTANNAGRLTLNPIRHLDPIGSLLIVLAGFGWGKPVPVNPANFRYPRRDDILVAAAGPAMNVLQALVFGLTLRALGTWSSATPGVAFPTFLVGAGGLLWTGFSINVLLAVFNIIPVGPLDGAHILQGLLPLDQAARFARFNQRFGGLALILLFITPVAGYVLEPVKHVAARIIVGDTPFLLGLWMWGLGGT